MRHFRFVLAMVAVWIVAMLVVRQFVCIGWVVPIRVASQSMAPALYGPHFKTTCSLCGYLLHTRANPLAKGDQVAGKIECSNCGHSMELPASEVPHRGSRVTIDRWALHRRRPERFDIMAVLLTTGGNEKLITKRIVGMPGEAMTLRSGDILANGQMIRKSANQFTETAILVHSDRYRRPDVKPQWSSTVDSGWTPKPNGYRWVGPSEGRPEAGTKILDWLGYSHRRPAGIVAPLPNHRETVFDDYPFNQGISRPLHCVHDLALSAELRWSGAGILHVRFPTPYGTCEMRLAATNSDQWDLTQCEVDGWPMETVSAPIVARQRSMNLLVGYWDRQIVCRLGDQEVLRHPFDSSPTPSSTSRPDGARFSLAANHFDELSVMDLRMWRDLYYYLPDDHVQPERSVGVAAGITVHPFGHPLDIDSYLLLGDNVPISMDARYGSQYGVFPESEFLGVVRRVN
jgi:signal peptidase I